MKRLLLLLVALTLLLGSCGAAPQPPEGNEPQRVAVLFSSLAEIWLEAGGEIAVTVGETVERGFVPADTPLVDSGAGKTINVELLIASKPDLVICSADIPAQVEAAQILAAAGAMTLVLRIETVDDYIEALRRMTEITGDEAAYARGLAMKAEIDSLLAADNVQSLKGKTVLFVRAGSTASSTKPKSSADHFAAMMLREFGCINLADRADTAIDGIGMEAILAADPDYIFFSLMGDEASARDNVATLLASDTWQALSAVKAERAVILDRTLFHFKPCGRWAEAYQTLADLLTEDSL
ncbi:MAG: ABC transporter substrate-binding protein [Clostridia bacterium]|nr:ABC transporter substrate-binding protein [Clostridia bacterium]